MPPGELQDEQLGLILNNRRHGHHLQSAGRPHQPLDPRPPEREQHFKPHRARRATGIVKARQWVSKHLAVLEAANLVTTVQRGREKLHYLNTTPINEIEQRWINQYDRGRIQALGDLKLALEGRARWRTDQFVYTTYMNGHSRAPVDGSSPTLRSPTGIGDWKLHDGLEGRVANHLGEHHGVTIADPEQVVLKAAQFHRIGPAPSALAHTGVGPGQTVSTNNDGGHATTGGTIAGRPSSHQPPSARSAS